MTSFDFGTKISTTAKLTPEYRRAISVMCESLKCWEEYFVHEIPSDLVSTNKRCFLSFKVTKDRLPYTSEWGWNQSNGKKVVVLDNMYTLELFKYNPIRKYPSAVQPSYKMWLGNIKVMNSGETFSFLWCEKGKKVEEPVLRIQDYAFLSQFADPKISKELGWC